MPNIKPISDLHNYDDVLSDIAVGSPVFLTLNGRGRYVIIDMAEYEKQQAAFGLLSELIKSESTAEEKGWQRRANTMNEESVAKMKELVKEASQQNKIMNVSEAFRLYPVEEEPHKGNLEYWTQRAKKLEV